MDITEIRREIWRDFPNMLTDVYDAERCFEIFGKLSDVERAESRLDPLLTKVRKTIDFEHSRGRVVYRTKA